MRQGMIYAIRMISKNRGKSMDRRTKLGKRQSQAQYFMQRSLLHQATLSDSS